MVDDYKDMESYLLSSGFSAQSMERVWPHFPGMRRQMHQRGFARVPRPLSSSGPDDDQATTLFMLFVKQAMDPGVRDASSEHHLRNVTGVRPGGRYKP
jgi:hypothetical protein